MLKRGVSWRSTGFNQSPDEPVLCISSRDAAAYAEWLAKTTGKPYRLPTEAEWEYAARAGSTKSSYWGNVKGAACTHSNVLDASVKHLINDEEIRDRIFPCNDGALGVARVGSYAANKFGLHDMLGNVYELSLIHI